MKRTGGDVTNEEGVLLTQHVISGLALAFPPLHTSYIKITSPGLWPFAQQCRGAGDPSILFL